MSARKSATQGTVAQRYYTPREVSRMFGIGYSSVYSLISQGKLGAVTHPSLGCIRIPESAVRAFEAEWTEVRGPVRAARGSRKGNLADNENGRHPSPDDGRDDGGIPLENLEPTAHT